jgi:hypothetical protein
MRTAALAPFLGESRSRFAPRRNSFPLHAIQRKTPTTLVTGVSVNQWVRGIPLSPFEAPRAGLNLNRGFVELGSYALNRLRRKPIIEFYAWNAPPTSKKERDDPGKPGRDPLRLARYYRSLLDTGKFESQAALARFLGVSRARVTQVLNRLKSSADTIPAANDLQLDAAAG